MEKVEKNFRKRNAILACLRQTTEHPSAEWVHAKLKSEYPDISLGTVYRNLARFKEQGEIISVGTVNGVERFDGNTAPHVHFVCNRCTAVLDLPEIDVPEALSHTAEQSVGGRVDACQLTFYGECTQCQAKDA